MNDVDKLLEALRIVNELITTDAIKQATNEQLLEYIELTNKIKAIILSNM